MLKIVEKIDAMVTRILKYLSIALFSILILTVFIQVTQRIISFPFSTIWTIEASQYSFIWLSVFGSAIILCENRNVSLDILVKKLKFKTRKIVEFFISGVIIGIGMFLIIGSNELLPLVHRQISPAMHLKMSYVYVSAIVAGLLFILFSTTRIIRWSLYKDFKDITKFDIN